MKIGDRVAYRAAFLRSIGDYSARSADRRGTILGLEGQLALVKWQDATSTVNVGNLILANKIHLEPA